MGKCGGKRARRSSHASAVAVCLLEHFWGRSSVLLQPPKGRQHNRIRLPAHALTISASPLPPCSLESTSSRWHAPRGRA